MHVHRTTYMYVEVTHLLTCEQRPFDLPRYKSDLSRKIEKPLLAAGYTFKPRTKYIYIESAHIYIEPNTYTSKLHPYNGTVQINRNAFVHIEIICVRRAFFIWSIEWWKLSPWATGQRLHKQELQSMRKDVGKKPADCLRTGAILPFFARLVNAFTWGELVIRLCAISLPKTWWFRKSTKRFVFKVAGLLSDLGSTTIWPRCSLTYCQPTEAALRGLIWFGFAWRGRGTTFNRQPAEWVLCFRPRLHISETQSLLEVLGISLGNHRKKPECFRKNFAEAKARAWFH